LEEGRKASGGGKEGRTQIRKSVGKRYRVEDLRDVTAEEGKTRGR